MNISLQLRLILLALLALLTLLTPAFGADPGVPYPSSAEISDQKVGTVLFYNLYSSSLANPLTQNTKFSMTNTSSSVPVTVRLYFVDGATCTVADAVICLTVSQTASFLASDIDPGVTGYLVAVAVDSTTGCPISHNFLSGNAHSKLASGHQATLPAEAFSALYSGDLPGCDAASVTAALNFDGVVYNRVPRVLALEKVRSRVDNNDTLLILNSVGGSLTTGASSLGSTSGTLYDDASPPIEYGFTFSAGVCQFRSSLSNNFPRLTPRFETVIPAGHTGWLKFSPRNSDNGLLGAAINFNPNAGVAASAFNGGHNLRKLALATTASYTVPVFPTNCGF